MDFQSFPKMARLTRECVISEKIDGTNAQIFIELASDAQKAGHLEGPFFTVCGDFVLAAGSRNRWITPTDDNYSFARWVLTNQDELVKLGPGRHFGEWWGSGIQRGYGLAKGEKVFSLFNTLRWHEAGQQPKRIPSGDPRIEKFTTELPACCRLVPELYRGNFDTSTVNFCLYDLKSRGSVAAPGFMKPEGVVVWHTAANVGFKKTLENDESPKSQVK